MLPILVSAQNLLAVVPGAGTPTSPSNPATGQVATLPNPLGNKVSSIPDLFYKIVNVVVDLSYVIIAFFLLYSGFKFVMAQGSEDKLKDAKQTFYYTIIGALIIIGAQTIINVVKSVIDGLKT